jgi:DnaJ-domain-containing protein 1
VGELLIGGLALALREVLREPVGKLTDKVFRKLGISDAPDEPPRAAGPKKAAPPREWHEILGVPPNATKSQISAAHKERIQKLHPDKISHMAKELVDHATKLTQTLNQARDEGLRRVKR